MYKMSDRKMNLFKYLREGIKYNLIVLLLIIIGQGCLVLWGVSIANLVSSLASHDVESAKRLIVLLVLILLVWSVQIFLHSHFFIKAVQTMNQKMRQDIIKALISSDIQGFNEYDTGTFVSWLTNDITAINTYGFANLEMLIRQIVGIVFSFVAIIYFHYSITIVVVLLSIVMLLLPKVFSKGLNNQMKKVSEVTDHTTNIFTDTLQGFIDLIIMNKTLYLSERIEKASLLLKEQKVRYATKSGVLLGVTNGQSLLSQVILLSFTSWLFFGGYVPIGALSGVQYLAATIFSSLTGLSANYIEMGTVKPIFEKFNSLNKDSVIKKNIADSFRSITTSNLSFSYPGNLSKTLDNVNVKFNKGKKYAIIADSGKGKTTLLNIISGITEGYSGEIMWNNESYDSLEKNSLRQQIMYITQSPHIFNDTLLANITLGSKISTEMLDQILDDVGLTSLINSLENGLDTTIEYNSKNISGGQRQRIALARGLVLEKQIFILDEITSSLDTHSAKSIENILLTKSGVTVIIVNHNISKETEKLLDKSYYI